MFKLGMICRTVSRIFRLAPAERAKKFRSWAGNVWV